jgi:hypothetical protein
MKTESSLRSGPSGLKMVICATLAVLITVVTTQTIVHAAVPGYLVALAQPASHCALTGELMSLVQSL